MIEKYGEMIGGIKLCAFGDYKKDYIRNDVVVNSFRENGIEVHECHTERKGLGRIIDLYRQYRNIPPHRFVLVVSSDTARPLVILLKLISKKVIVWDAHYSLYDSWVNDRQLTSPFSLKGFYYWFLDWVACRLADFILLDTNSHIEYFVKEFYLSKDKFIRVLVGANELYLRQQAEKNKAITIKLKMQNAGKFVVHFHGKYIPLQGIQYIVEAAKELESNQDIVFNIVGKGQTYNKIKSLAKSLAIKNINFIDRIPYD